MPFTPVEFLTLVDEDLLERYFQEKQVSVSFKNQEKTAENAGKFWAEQIKPLPKAVEIQGDFQNIWDMGSESGKESLLERAEYVFRDDSEGKAKFLQGFQDHDHDLSSILYVFLEYHRFFEETLLWDQELQDWGSEYELNTSGITEGFFTEEKKSAFQEALRKYLKKSKASGDLFETQLHSNQHCICLSVYFEGSATTDFGFGAKNKLERIPRKSTKRLHFFIFPNENKVALKMAKSRLKTRMKVMEMFIETVMGENFHEDSFRSVALNKLLDANEELAYSAADGVQFVRVKLLRLEQFPSGRQLILQVGDGRDNRAIHDFKEMLGINSERIYKDWRVTQAKIQVQFDVENPIGKKGSVTTLLTTPHSCDLQDKPLHIKCRKLLKHWGLLS